MRAAQRSSGACETPDRRPAKRTRHRRAIRELAPCRSSSALQQGQHLSTARFRLLPPLCRLLRRVSSRISLKQLAASRAASGGVSATRVGHPPVRRAPHGRLDCPQSHVQPGQGQPGAGQVGPQDDLLKRRQGHGGAEDSNSRQRGRTLIRKRLYRKRATAAAVSPGGAAGVPGRPPQAPRPSSTRQRASYQRSRYQAARSRSRRASARWGSLTNGSQTVQRVPRRQSLPRLGR